MKILPKYLHNKAEIVAINFLRDLGCVNTRRAIKTKFQKVDFFGADVVGKKTDGSTYYIQATTGKASALSQRRKKLRAVDWNNRERVFLLQLDVEKVKNKNKYLINVWELIGEDFYLISEDQEIDKEYLKNPS
jgi:hypothetical protein